MFSYGGSYGSRNSGYNSLYSGGGWDDYLGSSTTGSSSSSSNYASYISGYASKFGNLGQNQKNLLGMVGDSFGLIQQVMEMEQQIYQMVFDQLQQQNKPKSQGTGTTGTGNGTPTSSGNTVDVNGDGKADVVVDGEGAEQLAARIKEITENHPKIAELLLQGAKQDLSQDGMYHIEIKDLGGNVAGLAEVGQKGEGTMGFGHMWIDDKWQGVDSEQFAEIFVHELGHNAGFNHGSAHDQWIQSILH